MATNTRPSTPALGTLLGSSAALTALAVYQWLELLELRNGHAPACAINATVNCATVWNSALASKIHETLGIPVAGLGVIYGAVGMLLTALAWRAREKSTDDTAFVSGIKLWALAGAASCLTFIGASLQAGAVCLTCLGTYVLTAAFVYGALKLLPGPMWPASQSLATGGAWVLVLSTPLYLGLLGPGGRTPKSSTTKVETVTSENGTTTLAEFAAAVDALPERDKQQVALARQAWLAGQPQDASTFPVRMRKGPADAPVHIVDFTDILCGHCRAFESAAAQIAQAAPEGSFSIEARHFPLDGECNPNIERVVGDGVRCLAAKVQICLEQDSAFSDVRHELFENQQRLTKDLIMEVATRRSGKSADALMSCVNDPQTLSKLHQDVAYAMRYQIDGTPLVLVNGRETPPVPVFILGMVLTHGDANAAVFTKLPVPPAARNAP